MTSKTSHKIKNRKVAKDVFITPVELAIKHIEFTAMFGRFSQGIPEGKMTWYDPFKNTGNYYNNFPETQMGYFSTEYNKDWAEILEGRDFFEYEPDTDNLIICSNPPYSMMDKIYKRCIELKAKCISLLVAFHSITPKRIEYMEHAGYKITGIHICKVFEWYGMSAMVVFTKTEDAGLLSYDRKVWR
tara:strand:+ start:704 stop:1264 length:561 start_codon:yes stop_codon:yes gene_type:complete